MNKWTDSYVCFILTLLNSLWYNEFDEFEICKRITLSNGDRVRWSGSNGQTVCVVGLDSESIRTTRQQTVDNNRTGGTDSFMRTIGCRDNVVDSSLSTSFHGSSERNGGISGTGDSSSSNIGGGIRNTVQEKVVGVEVEVVKTSDDVVDSRGETSSQIGVNGGQGVFDGTDTRVNLVTTL